MVWAVEIFKTMLVGKFFLLETDHQALRSILTTKNPERRLARWIIKLQEMDFEIAFRPGARTKNADFILREWAPVEEWEDDVPIPGATPGHPGAPMCAPDTNASTLEITRTDGRSMTPNDFKRVQEAWEKSVDEDLRNEYAFLPKWAGDAAGHTSTARSASSSTTLTVGVHAQYFFMGQVDAARLEEVQALDCEDQPRLTSVGQEQEDAEVALHTIGVEQQVFSQADALGRKPAWNQDDLDVAALAAFRKGAPLPPEYQTNKVKRDWFEKSGGSRIRMGSELG